MNRSNIQINNNLTEYQRAIKAAVKLEMKAIGRNLVKKIRAILPVRTGNLKRNFKARYDTKTECIRIGYGSKGFYGGILEEGYKKPVGKLKTVWSKRLKKNVRRLQATGTITKPAKHYMLDAVIEDKDNIQEKISQAIDRIRQL